jgi:hypothetical protein
VRYIGFALAGVIASLGCNAGKPPEAGAPEVASSPQAAAPEVSDAAAPDQSTTPDAAAWPEVGAPDVPPGRVPYRAIALSIGEYHACVILDDHKVKCWGSNSVGQLGLGDMKNRGASPGEMGDNLPTVDLGTGRTAKAIAARVYTTCALLDDDSVKCWGAGFPAGKIEALELGAGRKATSLAFGDNDNGCVTTDDQGLVCWEGDYKRTPTTLRPGTTIVDLASGFSATALYSDGTISSLGVPSTAFTLDSGTHARALFGAYSKLCATLDTGGLKCWFLSGPGAVAPPTSDTDVEAVALSGTRRTCWLKKSGAVACSSYDPPSAPRDTGSVVQLGRPAAAIDRGGMAFVCALLDDGSVKCWGDAPAPPWWTSDPATPGWPAVDLGTRPAP